MRLRDFKSSRPPVIAALPYIQLYLSAMHASFQAAMPRYSKPETCRHIDTVRVFSERVGQNQSKYSICKAAGSRCPSGSGHWQAALRCVQIHYAWGYPQTQKGLLLPDRYYVSMVRVSAVGSSELASAVNAVSASGRIKSLELHQLLSAICCWQLSGNSAP